jgi:hypothetical protein
VPVATSSSPKEPPNHWEHVQVPSNWGVWRGGKNKKKPPKQAAIGPFARRFWSACPNVHVFLQKGRPLHDEVSRWAAPALAFALVFLELNICAAATSDRLRDNGCLWCEQPRSHKATGAI